MKNANVRSSNRKRKAKKRAERITALVLAAALILLMIVLITVKLASDRNGKLQDGTETVSTENETGPDTSFPPETEPVTDPGTEPETEPETTPPDTQRPDGYPYVEPVKRYGTIENASVPTNPFVEFPDYPPFPNEPYRAIPADMQTLYGDVILPETEKGDDEYLDSIVFLGDSRTYGIKFYNQWYHYLKDGLDTKQVWTPSNGTITLYNVLDLQIYYPDDDVEIPLTECVRRKRPKVLVIMLGMNGIGWQTAEQFRYEYGKVIEMVLKESPETKILLGNIPPVTRTYGDMDFVNNYKVCLGNAWIAQLAQIYGLKVVDLYSHYVGEDGYLPEEYNGGDGLHFSPTAYVEMIDYFLTHR